MKNPIRGLDKWMRRADIPMNFERGLPEIRISAMRSLVIEPHRGVRSFSQDSVMIETGSGLLHIQGSEIMIESMTWHELRLQGRFSALALVDGHAV